jgi:hypothetical protein
MGRASIASYSQSAYNVLTTIITDVRAVQAKAKNGRVHVIRFDTDAGIFGIGETETTRERFKFWNVPNPTRRDGSVQNW